MFCISLKNKNTGEVAYYTGNEDSDKFSSDISDAYFGFSYHGVVSRGYTMFSNMKEYVIIPVKKEEYE